MLYHPFHPPQHAPFRIPQNFGMKYGVVALVYNIVRQQTHTGHKRCYVSSNVSRKPRIFLLLSIRLCITVHVKAFKGSNVQLLQYFYHYFEPILCTFKCSIDTSCLWGFHHYLAVFLRKEHVPPQELLDDFKANSGHLLIEKALYVLERLGWIAQRVSFGKVPAQCPKCQRVESHGLDGEMTVVFVETVFLPGWH